MPAKAVDLVSEIRRFESSPTSNTNNPVPISLTAAIGKVEDHGKGQGVSLAAFEHYEGAIQAPSAGVSGAVGRPMHGHNPQLARH
jgi:hypothetical protein